ncbi:MAG: beta-hydroxyacyl-ACP dehydratase [Planctomycetes bacterium]|jgi:3-hydroxyacyl-[acyl-carrier-protein] dehydratase|nr:beta-hydroxyacyl-ACP dehydratase [Planctomycetota bacterium]
MPVSPLFDLDQLDLDSVVFDKNAIRSHNPHRFEFELIDAICHFDSETLDAVGYHDLKEDAFWVRGHIPGTPIFPGALMIESAAQLSAFCYRHRFGQESDRFFGFGGIDKLSFRGMASPGQRLWMMCKDIVLNRRRSRFAVQGIVEDRIVFSGEIIGVSMPVVAKLDGEAQAQQA